jgi:hypothetical protein
MAGTKDFFERLVRTYGAAFATRWSQSGITRAVRAGGRFRTILLCCEYETSALSRQGGSSIKIWAKRGSRL